MDELIQGRYRLLRLLGEGGAAQVWLARDERVDRLIALKRLRPQYASDAALVARFQHEAKLVARLDSPHIVQVYDVAVSPTECYIAMEFVDGQDLKEFLRFEGPLPVERALALLREIAAGVAVAHEAGLIHRDLKPGNVLLSKQGAVKITDFGIARDVAGAGMTEPGTVWGTSHYIAPEQAAGKPISAATDIYSLGVLLFETLTGTLPFPGDDPVAVAIAHIQQPVPSVQARAPSVPAGVARLVERMMAKDPAQRPANGAALVTLLDSYLRSTQATSLHPTIEGEAADATQPITVPPVEPDAATRVTPVATETPVPPRVSSTLPHARWPSGLLMAFVGLCAALMLLGLLAARNLAGQQGESAANPPDSSPPASQPTVVLGTFTPPPGAATATPPATATLTPASPTPPILTNTGPRVGNGPDARALLLTEGRGIELDGNLSEWDTSQPVPLLEPTMGRERWAGEADLSGVAYFAWDDEFLYLAVERTDEEHIQTRTVYELYRDDSIELWLDADLLGDLDEAAVNADDFQFAFSAGDFADLKAEGVAYYPDRNDRRNRQLRVRAEPLPTGYTMEISIPWAILAVEPSPGLVLGYAIVLNDNDSPVSNDPQTQIASNRQPPFEKPLTFGNLILSSQ